MSDKITWRNERRKLSELQGWELNPKRLSEKQGEGLRISIDKFGFAVPLLISEDGEIYDGHQRKAIMELMEEYGANAEVDVRVSSRPLTSDERRELVVRMKQNQADWNFDMIGDIYEPEELEDWGFEEWQLGGIGFDEDESAEDPGPQIDKAEELREQWQTEVGQLWRIPSKTANGEHRIICGDCTDPAVVGQVMGGEKANLLFTSPPYWVGKSYETQRNRDDVIRFIDICVRSFVGYVSVDFGRIVLNTGTGRRRAVEGDSSIAETWLLLDWWVESMNKRDWALRHCRIWSKNGGLPATISPFTDVIDQHWEFIATFYSPNGKHRGQERVDASWPQQGVWDDIAGDRSAGGTHEAAFPIDIPERNIMLYSKLGEFVLEPFLGSGTTLAASERLGRLGRGIELSPSYVAVALQRLADIGLEPELVEV